MLTQALARPARYLRNLLGRPEGRHPETAASPPAAPAPPNTFRMEPMWFLSAPDTAIEQAAISPLAKRALRALRDDGLAILPGHVSAAQCDAVVRAFEAYCASHPESAEYRDAFSLHERLACLHLESADTLALLTHAPTVDILQAAFRQPPAIVGSLFFEKGSTQSIHRDTPAFLTNPLNHFVGVWHALEDVVEGSGPLTYYEKGHLVAPDAALYRAGETGKDAYFRLVRARCAEAGSRLIEYYPKKGDVVIWHPELPHGGGPITRPGTSRRSLVGHFMPDGIAMLRPEAFYERGDPGPDIFYPLRRDGGAAMIDHGAPRFFHNVYDGNFDEI